ncbi:MAG TPA: ABC transporter ATP-binding protein [Mycobacteriales bacterium]|jgi:ABC-type branched-subunit amino acid transport system ATPase component|nr:ABC transporter ATP-binding protein [Mycobacteriales bacterium]
MGFILGVIGILVGVSIYVALVGLVASLAYSKNRSYNLFFAFAFVLLPIAALVAWLMKPGPARQEQQATAAVATERATGTQQRVEEAELRIDGLRVAFGGLVAVDGVSLSAPTGRITGLIGPNGAGKTTTFNACSGLNRHVHGKVTFDGRDVSRRGPAARARMGLGRTFQQMELFDSLTTWENVALGFEGGKAGVNPLGHLVSSPISENRKRAVTDDAIALCGLQDLAEIRVGSLSTGQRRLVELARCLTGPYQVLLLDEPSSGLDRVETARFGEILQQIVAERGVGILLVEHDMALVTEVCDYIYVLDFGKPIFEGSAAEVMASPIVQAAYLGGEEAAQDATEGDNPLTTQDPEVVS